MGPVEGFYLSVAGTIVLIGLARGYKKELGNTLVFIGAVFIFAAMYEMAWDEMITVTGAILSDESVDIFLCALLSIIFVAIVFASYAGRTLDFHGKPAPAPGGFFISLAVALVNGYLVAGTLWFFQAIFSYPLRRIFDWFIPTVPECQEAALLANDLTASSVCVQDFIANGQPMMWPPVLFPSAIFWAIPLAIMIILKVRG